MSGDALKKVQVGQRMQIPAATFNTFIDAAKDYLQRQQSVGGSAQGAGLPAGVVLVRNDTGADRDLFEIVALDGPVYTPQDNEEGFKFRPALKGILPDSDHFGNFAVLLAPVRQGAIGPALVQGITAVRLKVPESAGSLQYADICTDEGEEAAHLVASGRGAAYVLWMETQDNEETGDRWALVRVSNATPADAVAAVHTLKVTGVFGAYGVPFDPGTHRFILYVTGYFAFADKSWVDESTEYIVKATHSPASAAVGFKSIQVGDYIGYVLADGFEPVPGGPDDATYDGQVIPFPGPEGALLSTSQEIIGGPGILVEPDPNPQIDKPKVSVELADTDPGLEFTPTQDPDDGQLRVKPDSDRGIDVGAAGVKVIPNEDAGITVDADGIAVIPNTNVGIDVDGNGVFAKVDDLRGVDVDPTGIFAKVDVTRGIDVDAQGLFVIVNTNQGVDVDAQGVKALADATRAVSISQDGIGVDVDGNYALQVSGSKVQVVVKVAGGIELTDGALDIPEHADGGLNHREDGRLGVKADSNRGLDTDTDGVFVRLKSTGGLGFDAGEVAHDPGTAAQGQLVTDATGENLGTQDAADLFDANGHLVATAGKKVKHTKPGAFAYGDESIPRGFHGIGLDANGHVRKIWLSGLGWIGPNA